MTSRAARKVLIIDDERPILMTLEALLSRHGYLVESARTAALGLEMAQRANGPELILLDIGLPDASGLEVLTKVKQSSAQIQIIVLTGQDSLSNAIESIKLGAFHFIGKPYAPEELLSLMKRALEQQELVRETESLREGDQGAQSALAQSLRSDGAGVQKPADGRDRGVHLADRALGSQRARHRRKRRRQGGGRQSPARAQPALRRPRW